MSHSVRVRTPCRLHFGMFSFGRSDHPRFGGVGVMIEPPSVEVTFSPSERFDVRGDHSERARQFAEMASRSWQLPAVPACEVEVHAPPDHTGLGVGTQLGLAVAAGLRLFASLPQLPVVECAAAVGRGKRSAVGTYGFDLGGLIVDAGLNANTQRERLAERLGLPSAWRFVLIRPTDTRGLAGDREVEAFAKLPPVSNKVTDELWTITNQQMMPAAKNADCYGFGEAVYRFGLLAGESFAAIQGGPFTNRRVADLVSTIRNFGVPGVGQSSWGPTVFAITPDEQEAARLVNWLHEAGVAQGCEVAVAKPNNSGAMIEP